MPVPIRDAHMAAPLPAIDTRKSKAMTVHTAGVCYYYIPLLSPTSHDVDTPGVEVSTILELSAIVLDSTEMTIRTSGPSEQSWDATAIALTVSVLSPPKWVVHNIWPVPNTPRNETPNRYEISLVT